MESESGSRRKFTGMGRINYKCVLKKRVFSTPISIRQVVREREEILEKAGGKRTYHEGVVSRVLDKRERRRQVKEQSLLENEGGDEDCRIDWTACLTKGSLSAKEGVKFRPGKNKVWGATVRG